MFVEARLSLIEVLISNTLSDRGRTSKISKNVREWARARARARSRAYPCSTALTHVSFVLRADAAR